MIRIVLADDHLILREGLRQVCRDALDIVIVGEAADAAETLAHVRNSAFDLLLLDLSMPGSSDLELVRQIREEAPALAILIFSMHEPEHYAVRVIRAGARGYLSKDSSGEQLLDAIRKVASGRLCISHEVAEQFVLDAIPDITEHPHKQLTAREFEVFNRLIAGATLTDVSKALSLSAKTVSTHKTRIFQKIGVTSLAALVHYAVAHRLLSQPNGVQEGC
jgi:DNA-binding NarL/FixJ family response regulator